jgi:septation ring formation regulator EzrA
MLWFHTHKTKRNRIASSFAFAAVAEQVSDAEVTASSFAFAAAVAAVDLSLRRCVHHVRTRPG